MHLPPRDDEESPATSPSGQGVARLTPVPPGEDAIVCPVCGCPCDQRQCKVVCPRCHVVVMNCSEF